MTSSSQPGFINKTLAFLLNRAKRIREFFPQQTIGQGEEKEDENGAGVSDTATRPIIERVVIARKMTELASLLERREEILVQLEVAHIRLANKASLAVKIALEGKSPRRASPKDVQVAKKRRSLGTDVERGILQMDESVVDEPETMERLIEVLRPFVHDFGREQANRSNRAVSRTSPPDFRYRRPPSIYPPSDNEQAANSLGSIALATTKHTRCLSTSHTSQSPLFRQSCALDRLLYRKTQFTLITHHGEQSKTCYRL
jgi:hypothetical protein